MTKRVTSQNIFTILTLLVSGSLSLLVEFAFADGVALVCGQKVLWESITVGTYILGIGFGALNNGKSSDLARIQMHLGIVSAMSGILFLGFHALYRIYVHDFVSDLSWVNGVFAQSLVFALGFLSGVELSIFLQFISLPLVLGAYHVGACVAVAIFYGGARSFFVTQFAGGMAVVGLAYSIMSLVNAKLSRGLLAVRSICVLCWMCVVVSAIFLSPRFHQAILQNYYYNTLFYSSEDGGKSGPESLFQFFKTDHPKIHVFPSNLQLIELVPSQDGGWALYLDRHFQFHTKKERDYHEALAFFPQQLFAAKPTKVLILGGGDGLLARELLKQINLRIDLVELDPGMIALALSPRLKTLNEGAFESPRLKLHLADAYSWLFQNAQVFDAIYLDFPYPYDFEGLKLYSQEFFMLLKAHLSPQGFLAFDFPVAISNALSSAHEFIASTLEASGFKERFAYRIEGEGFVFARLAAPQKSKIPLELHGGEISSLAQSPKDSVNSLWSPVPLAEVDHRF